VTKVVAKLLQKI